MLTLMTNRKVTFTPAQARIKTLLDSGLNVRQIAAALDVSTQAVYKTMKAAGLAVPSKRVSA